jgi:hypothetical protein
MEVLSGSSRLLTVGPSGVAGGTAISTASGPPDPNLQARLPIHTATLVDDAGRAAFAAADGRVGVASSAGVTELGEAVCGRGAPPMGAPPTFAPRQGPRTTPGARPSAGFAGLVPTGPNAFLVACEGGLVLQIRGQ